MRWHGLLLVKIVITEDSFAHVSVWKADSLHTKLASNSQLFGLITLNSCWRLLHVDTVNYCSNSFAVRECMECLTSFCIWLWDCERF